MGVTVTRRDFVEARKKTSRVAPQRGFTDLVGVSVAVKVEREPSRPIELRFETTPLARGRVFTAQGAAAQANVTAFYIDANNVGGEVYGVGRPDGSYFVDVPTPGRYGLVAHAQGHSGSGWQAVLVFAQGISHDLRLGRLGEFCGQVVMQDGSPCPKSSLHATA